MPALLVFALSWLAYAWTAAPASGWLDAGEFIAASAQLGVPHPPGHPLPSLLGKALMLLPFGDGAWRVDLASSLAGACAALALYFVVVEALDARSGRRAVVIAAAAALGFAFSGAAWLQSVRAEVYALEAALVLAALAFILRYVRTRDRRALYAAGLAAGLGLANHHFVTILFFVPAAAVALALRPGMAAAGRTALLGFLGLAAFLYLPIRAQTGPEVNWGDPQHAGAFAWVVSAKAFQKSLGGPPSPLLGEAAQVATALAEQVSLPVAALALLGAYALLRRRGARGVGAVLLGVVVVGAAGRAVLGFDFDNPDAFGYLLPAQAALVALAACGASALLSLLPTRAALILALATLLFPVAQVARFGAATSLRGDYAGEVYGRAVLEQLPPRALLVTSYYETVFQLWALRAVEHDRPDVDLLDRNMLTHPYAANAARQRSPWLAGLIDAPLRGGAPSPIAALDEIARTRPIAFELAQNLDGDDPALPRLVPYGPIAWYAPSVPADEARTAAETRDATRSAEVSRDVRAAAVGDPHGTARILSWGAYLTARFYCLHDREAAGRAAIARAREAGADGEELDTLAAECGRP